jgi:ribosome-associated translation inhibitor RaiA
MTNRYEELINAFEQKLKKLISEYKVLLEKNHQLESKLALKQNELMEAHHNVLELQKKYDHLIISKNLGVSDTERAESKKKIDKLVREIDNCLDLLKE